MILSTLVGQLERLARRGPILFVFEDAHWIDSSSLELLQRITERVRQLQVMMIITYRPEFEPPWTGESQVTSLRLSRLTRRESTALAERVAAGKPLPAEILDRVVERTDGIPLFVEELTKSVLEGGVLQEEHDRYVLTGSAPALAIPPTLQDSLMARLDRVPAIKEVAQIAAVIGREFSYSVLAAVAHHPEGPLREAIDQLVASGLAYRRGMPPDETYIFKHAFVQDAAYGTLLRGRRQQLHAAIAQVFEAGSTYAESERAALLAHHWLAAEDWERALIPTVAAAKRADALYARPEAISRYWQALDVLERLPANTDHTKIHADVILALAMLPGSLADKTAVARVCQHLDKAIEDALRDGRTAMAARLQAINGTIRDDERLLIEALRCAEASGDMSAEAFAEFRYSLYLGQHDQFEKSRAHVARSVEILGNRGELLQQAIIMSFGGRCYSARAGRLDESLAYAARAQEVAEQLDNTRLRAIRAMEAEPYLYKGDWGAAVEVAECALPLAWDIREWNVVGCASAWLAISYLKLGRIDDARRVLDRVLSEAPLHSMGNMGVHGQAFPRIALAQLHLATGDTGRALSVANAVLEFAEERRLGLEQGAIHRILGQVYGAMGKRDDADAAFRRSLEILDEIQSRPELAQTLLAYGRFRRGDNRQEDRALIERALALFDEIGATGWAEEARALRAEA